MADAAASARRPERPLSPHLQIYRWPVTMLTSILHRISGVGLGLGLLLVAWWLIAAAAGPEAYAMFLAAAGHWAGRVVLSGFTAALVYHLLNGIRHLAWDAGYGYEKSRAERTGTLVIALAVILTLAIWALAYHSMGAF